MVELNVFSLFLRSDIITTDLYDKVAKESKDSTASDHPLHYSETGKASTDHHRAAPGPVMAENLPEAASKEELRKRADELNKKS